MQKKPIIPLNPRYFTAAKRLIYSIVVTDIKQSMEKLKEEIGLRFEDIDAMYIIGENIEGKYNVVSSPLEIHIYMRTLSQNDAKNLARINEDLLHNARYKNMHLKLTLTNNSPSQIYIYFDVIADRLIHNEAARRPLIAQTEPLEAKEVVKDERCPNCDMPIDRKNVRYCAYCGYDLKPEKLVSQTEKKPKAIERLKKVGPALRKTSEMAIESVGLKEDREEKNEEDEVVAETRQFKTIVEIAKEYNLFEALKKEMTKDFLENQIPLRKVELNLGVKWEDWQGANFDKIIEFLPFQEGSYLDWLMEQASGKIKDIDFDFNNYQWIVQTGDAVSQKYMTKYRLWVFPKDSTEALLQGDFDTRALAEEYFNAQTEFKTYESQIEEVYQVVEEGTIFEMSDSPG
jgi:uncharacterized Zn finger protein (UPF0148 family)